MITRPHQSSMCLVVWPSAVGPHQSGPIPPKRICCHRQDVFQLAGIRLCGGVRNHGLPKISAPRRVEHPITDMNSYGFRWGRHRGFVVAAWNFRCQFPLHSARPNSPGRFLWNRRCCLAPFCLTPAPRTEHSQAIPTARHPPLHRPARNARGIWRTPREVTHSIQRLLDSPSARCCNRS